MFNIQKRLSWPTTFYLVLIFFCLYFGLSGYNLLFYSSISSLILSHFVGMSMLFIWQDDKTSGEVSAKNSLLSFYNWHTRFEKRYKKVVTKNYKTDFNEFDYIYTILITTFICSAIPVVFLLVSFVELIVKSHNESRFLCDDKFYLPENYSNFYTDSKITYNLDNSLIIDVENDMPLYAISSTKICEKLRNFESGTKSNRGKFLELLGKTYVITPEFMIASNIVLHFFNLFIAISEHVYSLQCNKSISCSIKISFVLFTIATCFSMSISILSWLAGNWKPVVYLVVGSIVMGLFSFSMHIHEIYKDSNNLAYSFCPNQPLEVIFGVLLIIPDTFIYISIHGKRGICGLGMYFWFILHALFIIIMNCSFLFNTSKTIYCVGLTRFVVKLSITSELSSHPYKYLPWNGPLGGRVDSIYEASKHSPEFIETCSVSFLITSLIIGCFTLLGTFIWFWSYFKYMYRAEKKDDESQDQINRDGNIYETRIMRSTWL